LTNPIKSIKIKGKQLSTLGVQSMEIEVQITFNDENSAFDSYKSEVTHIMQQATAFVVSKPEKGESKKLRDSNGNVVGKVEVLPF
jgi:hypothetical protein